MTLKKLFGIDGARQEVEEIMKEDETVNRKNNLTGKISYLNDKGWGFITSQDIPFEKIYFYWEGLKQGTLNFKELKKKMKVSFDAINNDKGWQAIKIEVINDERTDKRTSKD